MEATADKAGEEFFRHLVKHLALALDVTYAFVAEFAGSPTRVRTIALWGNGGWLDNVEYDLDGTPCEEVLRGALCLHPDGVQARFPKDTLLTVMEARSFLGVPLRAANGDTLGHLAVIDTKPMAGDRNFQEVFHLFADRARVELERLGAQAALEQASRDLEFRLERTARDLRLARDQLAALVEIQRAVAGHLDRKALFRAVAEALQGSSRWAASSDDLHPRPEPWPGGPAEPGGPDVLLMTRPAASSATGARIRCRATQRILAVDAPMGRMATNRKGRMSKRDVGPGSRIGCKHSQESRYYAGPPIQWTNSSWTPTW